jgi:cysteine synthase A
MYQNITSSIGHTPMVELSQIVNKHQLPCRLFAKVESANPGGSVKDRVALAMIEDAENKDLLTHKTHIIEPTSGNTGIGLCAVAAAKGYRVSIVMPESMSIERRQLMAAYGANVILSPASEGMSGAIRMAEQLAALDKNSWMPGQFTNPANVSAHYRTTGPEIWQDTQGNVDVFIAGIGTGGTITGVGKYLKEQNPSIQIIGVEPAASPVLSGGKAGAHKIQGIGAGFVPPLLDQALLAEILPISDEDAYAAARELAQSAGILAGISSGAALAAAIAVAKRPENSGKSIVILLPDSGERYLSTGLFG